MSDEAVEKYITLLFERSPASKRATAPLLDWYSLLTKFNEQQNYYILTQKEMDEFKCYGDMNPDLEMTPEEIIRLVYVLRDGTESLSLVTSSFYQDHESTNHPNTDTNPQQRKLKIQHNEYEIKKLIQERDKAKHQLHEYEARLTHFTKDTSERMSLLESRLEAMKIEADQQRAIVTDYKNREKERLEKIARQTMENQQLKEQLVTLESNAQAEREELQQENAKLIELIDKQKFDLDEARSHAYVDIDQQAWTDRINTLTEERDQYQQAHQHTLEELVQVQQELNDVQDKAQLLSSKFDHQHQLIMLIQDALSNDNRSFSSFLFIMSILPWLFLGYHLLIRLIQTKYGIHDPLLFLQYVDEKLYDFYST
ncbi:uncharacterized protein B0P05DRAFT_555199 [Gilbertella persicaria]|uniref:uncharacterized protein n=1 Tax=Gilbertella persicaria TaxID=101096 RepID=UPI00221E9E83|nr:uncharacterized protein B0P05DRAFT_555199 [Gilbertella persicaria]KAI8063661.1 hypothetical protein B0P05DRAFT_555199 [Gilbertella persicaria]